MDYEKTMCSINTETAIAEAIAEELVVFCNAAGLSRRNLLLLCSSLTPDIALGRKTFLKTLRSMRVYDAYAVNTFKKRMLFRLKCIRNLTPCTRRYIGMVLYEEVEKAEYRALLCA